MTKCEMLINCVPGEECRIAIVENDLLEEIYQERASSESHVGNIYKGRVVNVEPSIQAAFVEFGLERNGFLHITDLHPKYFSGEAREDIEHVGHKTPRRDRPPIQNCLRRGQEILVQILKEGISTKGPTLTSYISIPGRFLVMMPDMDRLGVSRKIEDDDARYTTRKLLDELKPPKGFGFIVRTAGVGQTKAELKRDLSYLVRLWGAIEKRHSVSDTVGELYAESDLVIRTIRDVYTTDIERIMVDEPVAAQRARDFLAIASPRSSSSVKVYQDPISLFRRYGIEEQIDNIHRRTVDLPSGGSLVIDSTEAVVAIDVNSGKMRDNADAETTAYKTNVEATNEICRQLRLRDLGGVIINDLIDMIQIKHRRAIEQQFRQNLRRDRARTRINSISQFGILEMTRQRMRPSLHKSIYMDCPHCEGTGVVKSTESVVLEVMRRIASVLHHNRVAKVELTISPDVAFQLLNRKRANMVELEQRHGKQVVVRVNTVGPIDFIKLEAVNERGSSVDTDNLKIDGPPQIESVETLDTAKPLDVDAEKSPTRPVSSRTAPTEKEVADETEDGPTRSKRRRRRGGRRAGKKTTQEPTQTVETKAPPQPAGSRSAPKNNMPPTRGAMKANKTETNAPNSDGKQASESTQGSSRKRRPRKKPTDKGKAATESAEATVSRGYTNNLQTDSKQS